MARARQSKRKSPSPSPRLASVFDDPPRKNVFLLCCMDQRLLDDTVRFMNGLNLHNRYDQVNRLSSPTEDSPSEWQPVFLHDLVAAIDVLHRPIEDVFLVDHLDCGAYKYLHPDEAVQVEYRAASYERMIELHADELRVLAEQVRDFCSEQRQAAEQRRAEVLSSCAPDTDCLKSAEKLHGDLVEAWTDIRVSYFVMDLLGKVTQLDVPDGQRDTLER
jgi:carbonic anhydrase